MPEESLKKMSIANKIIDFGEWKFDVSTGVIFTDTRKVRLKPRASQVFKLLIDRPGKVVVREELLQLWPASANTNNLDKALGEIRKAFHALGFNPKQIIETASGVGYELKILEPLAGETEQNGGKHAHSTSFNPGNVSTVGYNLIAQRITKRQLVFFVIGAISAIIFFFVFPKAYPYRSLASSVSAPQIEMKARGLISIYAPDRSFEEAAVSFETPTDWEFHKWVQLRGWNVAGKLLEEKTQWVVKGATWTLHFGNKGNLTYIDVIPEGHFNFIKDYDSQGLAAATLLADQLFQMNLNNAAPDPFRYNGHGYELLRSNEYINSWYEGAPFHWDFPEDKDGIARSVEVRMIQAPHLRSAELATKDKDDPQILHYPSPRALVAKIRAGINFLLIVSGLFLTWRWRKVLLRPFSKPFAIGIAVPLTIMVSADVWNMTTVFSSMLSDSSADATLIRGLSFAVTIVLISVMLFLLTSLALRLLNDGASNIKEALNCRGQRDFAIQLLAGISIGFMFLAVYVCYLWGLAANRSGTETSLWALSETPVYLLGYPLLRASEVMFFVLLTRYAISRFTSRRAVVFTLCLSVWVAAEFGIPDVLDFSYGFTIVGLSALQGALVYSVLEWGKPLHLISCIITVTSGLINYFFFRVFWEGSAYYFVCCVVFCLMVIYSIGVLVTSKYRQKQFIQFGHN